MAHGTVRRIGTTVSLSCICVFALLAITLPMHALELEEVTRTSPRLQVMLRLTTDGPIDEHLLRDLGNLRMRPVNPNRHSAIGATELIVIAPAGSLKKAGNIKAVTELEWLKQYPVAAHSFTYFEYVGHAPQEQMTFTIALPGSAPGRTRTAVHVFCRPDVQPTITADDVGNEFATITLADVQPGQMVHFDCFASYEYDAEQIMLRSAFFLPSTAMPQSWPAEAQPFIKPGFHIESESQAIRDAATEIKATKPAGLDGLINATVQYVSRHVRYNNDKRDKYFGGKFIYNSPWEMWQGAEQTLKTGTGCCPDSAELKVALLRALGVPARTAVHTGHLYAEIWIPDLGWITDGPMFNIPLLRSPDADNHTYFDWSPRVPVRCAGWGGRPTPFATLHPGMIIAQ